MLNERGSCDTRSVLILCLLMVTIIGCNKRISHDLEYIDKTTPDLKPLLFSKGFISSDTVSEFGSIFNTAKDEFYYAIDSANHASIICTKFREGRWIDPITILSDSLYSFNDPFLSNYEKRLYYISNKPRNEKDTISDYDIWYSNRMGDRWSSPINAGMTINTDAQEYYISIADNGNMYFASNRGKSDKRQHDFDIYTAQYKQDSFERPQKLSDSINSLRYEADVFVAPDESYIIYCSTRKTGFGKGDLYISFKNEDGEWSESINMGSPINTEDHELCPFVTKDRKYLFYTSNQDIYWIRAEIINKLKGK